MFRSIALSVGLACAILPASLAQEGVLARVVPEDRQEISLSFSPVVSKASPAVVNVYSRRVVAGRSPFQGDPFFERFFGGRMQSRPQEVQSLGSGVIVDPTGVIVTNNHVVAGAQELRVVLSDRREYEATLLLADERVDLAVLKIEAEEPLETLAYAHPGSAEVGDLVLAIGNPFGVGQTVTSGIVSALARTDVGISDYAFFIQTDAAVNPGNSGGALVDMKGRLIGVNTAIFSRSGGSNGIGFAIPVEMVSRIVDAALEGGELVRPWLGAKLQPVTNDLAHSLGLNRPVGAIISSIYPDSAADEAGLEEGDVLISIDGRDVNDENGVRFQFATRAIGDDARLVVLRDGRERTLHVAAKAAPGEADGHRMGLEGRNPAAGAQIVQLSPAFNEDNGIDAFMEGVMVVDIQRRSAADYFGFQPGDLIIAIQDERVSSVEDLEAIIERFDGEKEWPIEIERRGERFRRVLRM
ncbi:DegQ family serine endoprotease [Woodsholea maritima]|uniref:DegQ family serine endoprotease n=1 Tax=Woodsholea maritima TaxID=240237 RepID=UPI000374C5E2|nr:DegQ family serine endoprotease [Woodsholea maritima]